jgi:hypothetical protein
MAAALFHECFTTLFSAIVPNRLRNVGAKAQGRAASNLVLARQRTWLWLFVLAPLREICN